MKIVHEKLKGLESKWNLTWDFLGHKKYVDPEMCSQRDWKQTLITKVIQISAQMHVIWDIWTSQSLHVKLSILSFLIGFIIGGTMSFFDCF